MEIDTLAYADNVKIYADGKFACKKITKSNKIKIYPNGHIACNELKIADENVRSYIYVIDMNSPYNENSETIINGVAISVATIGLKQIPNYLNNYLITNNQGELKSHALFKLMDNLTIDTTAGNLGQFKNYGGSSNYPRSVFDGNGKTITITSDTPLFNNITRGEIKNLTVVNNVSARKTPLMATQITGSNVKGITLSGGAMNAKNGENAAASNASTYTAPMCVWAEASAFENCINNVPVTAIKYASGFVGEVTTAGQSSFTNCVNNANITAHGICNTQNGSGDSANAGGLIVFDKMNNTIIASCANKGTITADGGGGGRGTSGAGSSGGNGGNGGNGGDAIAGGIVCICVNDINYNNCANNGLVQARAGGGGGAGGGGSGWYVMCESHGGGGGAGGGREYGLVGANGGNGSGGGNNGGANGQTSALYSWTAGNGGEKKTSWGSSSAGGNGGFGARGGNANGGKGGKGWCGAVRDGCGDGGAGGAKGNSYQGAIFGKKS